MRYAMTKLGILFPSMALALLAGFSVSAHHNPGYYFNMGEVVIHSDATVVSFDAANPHGRLTYTMTDDTSSEKEWVAELPANNMMRRYGVTADMITAGEKITLRGNPGRSGATMLRVTHVLLPDGDVVTFYAPQGTGSPEDLQAN
jgi:hypothetical protein